MISMLVVCFYPLILSRFGTINFVSNYTAVAGFFLLGSADWLSASLPLLSRENQIIAAVICFALLFVSNMVRNLSNLISDTASASFFIFVFCDSDSGFLAVFHDPQRSCGRAGCFGRGSGSGSFISGKIFHF